MQKAMKINTKFKFFNSNNGFDNVTIALFVIFVLSLPFSESFISISSGLILLVQLALSFFRRNAFSAVKDPSLWLISSIFLIYVVGLLFTKDIQFGLYELKKAVFWLVLSFGVILSPKLSTKNFWFILTLFVFGVTVSTFFSFSKMLFHNVLGIENFRAVNFVSHIPFSFQISFSIFILFFSFFYENSVLKKLNPAIRIGWIIWLLFSLVVLKSMLGIAAFFASLIPLSVFIIKQLGRNKYRNAFIFVMILFFCLPLFYVGWAISIFYDVKYTSVSTVDSKTKLGNDYQFDFNQKFKENGYYVSWYVCEAELASAWNEKAKVKYNQLDTNGYLVSETLKRYLTSKGLKKDKEGVSSLTERDIQNIESGIANYIYDAPFYAIYPRIYETIWEVDRYILTGDANDQSFSQRIEYAKAALDIIKNNSWFGIGTGNFQIEFEKAFINRNSSLNEKFYGSAHNQYLSYLLKFGLVGFVYIMFVVFYVVYKKRLFRNPLFLIFFFYMMVANFGDSNWETHVGLPYFVFFTCLFSWHSPEFVRTKRFVDQIRS